MREFGVAALLRDPGHTDVIRAEWPLHITITPNFALDASIDRVLDLLSPVVATTAPITVGPGPDAEFGPNGEYRVVLVEPTDAVARWQLDRGIRQWSPGEMARSSVEREISRGEWWVVRGTPRGPLAGAVRIIDDDPAIWPGATDGGYVHGLMVARDRTGDGFGARILAAAETEIARRGRTWARLDCVASNAALGAYYLARGYRACGYRACGIHEYPPESGWQPSARFEKRVTTPTAAPAHS